MNTSPRDQKPLPLSPEAPRPLSTSDTIISQQARTQWSWGPAESSPYQTGASAEYLTMPRQKKPWRILVLAFVAGAVVSLLVVGTALKAGVIDRPSPIAKVGTPAPISPSVYIVTGTTTSTIQAVSPDNHPLLINVAPGTTFQREGLPAALKDITIGTRVNVRGKFTPDGSINAGRISILDPGLSGIVKSLGTSSLRLKVKAHILAVVLTSTTKIVDSRTRSPVKLSAIQPGQRIQIYGTLNAVGKLDAIIVVV
jgi:hypothetical protein